MAGGGLWTGAAVAGARLLWDAWVTLATYRRFLAPLLHRPNGPTMNWRDEILPLQWRLAVQTLVVWFAYSLFEPVLFQSAGAAEAGRFGMAWAALTAAQAGALAWVETRVPRFGVLAARREFAELDRTFFRVVRVSFALFLGACVVFASLVAALDAFGSRFAPRLLPLDTTLVLAGGLLVNSLVQNLNFYLRAHRREPAFTANLTANALGGLAVWHCGTRYGSFGAALAFLTVQGLLHLPWCAAVWLRFRRDEHGPRH